MEQEKIIEVTISNKKSLWSLNFFLLWQGRLVSNFGDAVYEIALGFWVLATTGSTTIMGILMASSMIPRIFLSPIAGTYVDRHKKMPIIVFTDFIRGVVITGIGMTIMTGYTSTWLIIFGGVVMGICGAYFGPAMQALMPELLHKEHRLKGNS